MVRQIFNEVIKQQCTWEVWQWIRIKVIHKKRWRWRYLETIARSALFLRCTNWLRQYSTSDFIPDLIKSKQKIRQGSDAHIKQWIIWRRAEWLNKDTMSGESKCGWLQLTSWILWFHHTQLHMGRPQSLWYRTWVHQPLEKILQKLESYRYDWRRKWHVRDKKNGPSRWSAVELALQHCSADDLERRPSALAKEKSNGYLLRRRRLRLPHEYALSWRCAPVLFYKRATPKMLSDFKHSTEKVGLKIIQEKRKFLAAKARTVEMNRDWQHQSWNIIKRRRYNISWPDDDIPVTGDDRDQESY